MHFTDTEVPANTTIRLSQSEVRRLVQSEHDIEGRLASARSALGEAARIRGALLSEGGTKRNERAVAAAEVRLKSAEAVVCKLEQALVSVRRDRQLAEQRLAAAHDHARRLDEAASIDLVICEIVDALKAFERASDRLASALEGSRGNARHTAPFVAASVRVSRTRFATEARAVVMAIEARRTGLLEGSVKLFDAAQVSDVEYQLTRAPQSVTAEPMLSIIPPSVPSVPVDSGTAPSIVPGRAV
jgi:hypothetical protein